MRKSILSIARIIFIVFLFLIGVLISIPFILDFGPINRKVTSEITDYLKHKTNHEIRLSGFSILYPHTLDLYNVYVEDDFQDTLVYAEKIGLDIFEPDIRNNIIKANECELKNAIVKIYFDDKKNINFNNIIFFIQIFR